MPRTGARRTIENLYRRYGFGLVAGVDEVGRGCLAGPVLAGAVVLDPARHIAGLADSKVLTAAARDRLYDLICRRAVAWAVGSADPAEIDRYNIHRASLRAMARAVAMLTPQPDLVLVDAFRIDGLPMAQRAVAGGDRREGDARPPDGRPARGRRPLRLRPAQRLCDCRPPGGGGDVRLLRGAPAVVQAGDAV